MSVAGEFDYVTGDQAAAYNNGGGGALQADRTVVNLHSFVAGASPEHCWVKFSDSKKSDFLIGPVED